MKYLFILFVVLTSCAKKVVNNEQRFTFENQGSTNLLTMSILGSGSTLRLIASGDTSINLLQGATLGINESEPSHVFRVYECDTISIDVIESKFKARYGNRGISKTNHCQTQIPADTALVRRLWKIFHCYHPSVNWVIGNSICNHEGVHYQTYIEPFLIKLIKDHISGRCDYCSPRPSVAAHAQIVQEWIKLN